MNSPTELSDARDDDPSGDRSEPNAEKLTKLAPIIARLEKARDSRVREAKGWASLGRNRPDQLGDFVLKQPIGRGGMGVVFEAHQVSLNRTVAIKILPRDLFRDEVQRKRFIQEAKTVASLHHTNIVPIYGVGFDEGCHYFVMQRLEGIAVDQRLEKNGPMDGASVAALGAQAASGLAHAHEQGILHRDIKPSNLIVGDQDDLWITDFGVAKTLVSDAITQDGDSVGTLRYMSPEQASGTADVRSDVYSLGLTLYEMASGEPAIGDSDLSDFLGGQSRLDIAPVRTLCPDMPLDLASIIETAMASNPDDRYATAQELADDLNRFLSGQSVHARPLGSIAKLRRWANQHPGIAILTSTLAVTLIALATTMTYNSIRLSKSNAAQMKLRMRAERSAEIATGALGDVFRRFEPGELSDATDSTVIPAMDPAAVGVLEELLPYYGKLSEQLDDEAASRSLTIEAYRALTTVAKIQMRLGNYENATRTFDRARSELPHLNWDAVPQAVEESRLDNEVGIIDKLCGDEDAAKARHEIAIDRLQPFELSLAPSGISPRTSAAATFELARSHYLWAWYLLPGMGPDQFPPPSAFFESAGSFQDAADDTIERTEQIKHLNRVIALGPLVISSESADPKLKRSMQVLLARALRQRGRSLPMRHWKNDPVEARKRQQDQSRSVAILRNVVEAYPQDDALSFELATSLSDLNVFTAFQSVPPPQELSVTPAREHLRQWRQTIERLQEANAIFSRIAAEHPSVPNYTLGLVHNQFRLARLIERPDGVCPLSETAGTTPQGEDYPEIDRESLVEALNLYRSSVQIQNRMAVATPDSKAYRFWQLLFLEHLAETEIQLGFQRAARGSRERVTNLWNRYADDHPYDREQFDQAIHQMLLRLDSVPNG